MKKLPAIAAVTLLLLTPFSAAAELEDCSKAANTIELNECMSCSLTRANAKMQRYFEASLDQFSYDETVVEAIHKAQEVWLGYQDAHCKSVYAVWRDGSIRGQMALDCRIQLTRQRTHDLWSQFLTYMDSSPPELPEPKR